MSREKDDIANALSKMAGGSAPEHHDAAHDHDAHADAAQSEQSPTAEAASKTTRPAIRTSHSPLEPKRTLIPILLVLGGSLFLGGLLCMLKGDESPFQGMLVPILMLILGLLVLAVAAIAMIQVRHLMLSDDRRP